MRPKNAKPSVCWYAPLQLLRTAQSVAIATIFGRHADPRVIEAITRDPGSQKVPVGGAPRQIHQYQDASTPFWIDYVSDTGDGWDATYTVAYYVAQDELALSSNESLGERGEEYSTQRGHILVWGRRGLPDR